ncbi:hypothetical protein [Streptomyces fulvorobeus]|uniref:Heavy metal-binding domain-containing protein n=1 Tax=Streptomyces fulvorobeus TaxID=284028 RepID=A0A7J0C0F6_9ACTN|nr:hypothetical protein [Streptomyces fulvorobeus]NYE39246.1 hypothetical protein [Streptomyces fulvorobeus]GFM95454.1 hypothetical protein Sfulv_02650 [Streptomyces fulvorobeus]
MNTGLKITAYAAALAAAFGTAYGVGKSADPVLGTGSQHAGPAHPAPERREKTGGEGHGGHQEGAGAVRRGGAAGGLEVSEGGYTLALRTPTLTAGTPGEIRFAIEDEHGAGLTDYRREHGKELHLVVASRDLTTYRHLHPVRSADGTWSAPVELPAAGGYRLFADFTPAGERGTNRTLGADLVVAGTFRPAGMPPVRAVAEVDGYRVALSGGLRAGRAGELTLTVSRDGRPVTDLQPHLGAYGHLVALRSGDLAYLHVHPNEGGPGPEVSFTATAPSVGTYRLFLDFRHGGEVRTASFTVEVAAADH